MTHLLTSFKKRTLTLSPLLLVSFPPSLPLKLMRNLELSYRLNGSYDTSQSTVFWLLTIFSILRVHLRREDSFFPFLFLFPPYLFTFCLSRHELCCSLIAPVPCAVEAKPLSVEHNTFAAVPQGDCKTGGLISGHSPLLMLLQSPVLWQPKELHPLELEWGGGTEGQPCCSRRQRPASAGVYPACGESRVPCSTKATSSSLPMIHCSLRGLAAIPGPPEGWSHCLLSGIRMKSRGALLPEPGTWHPSKELSGDLIGHVIQHYRTKQGKDPSRREGRKVLQNTKN